MNKIKWFIHRLFHNSNFFVGVYCLDCEGEEGCPTCDGRGWHIVLEKKCKTSNAVEKKYDKLKGNFMMCCHAEYLLDYDNESNFVTAIKETFTQAQIDDAINWDWVKDNPFTEDE
jgi:hypothetical protein